MSYILSLMLFLPAIGAAITYFVGSLRANYSRYSAVAFSVAELLLSLYVFASVYLSHVSGFIFQEQLSWIPGLVTYHVGVDGLGAPMLIIAAALTLFAMLGSFAEIQKMQRPYYSLLLLFLAATVGVFISLNLILFYFFWDASLLPMFFFIGIWGGPNRKYAASKFLLFTYGGSVAMLLGFLIYYFSVPSPTFDFLQLLGQPVPFWIATLSSALTFIGFGVKLPMVPIHSWLPDAHVEAPTPISVLLAGLLLKLGGYGILRFNIELFTSVAVKYAWVFIAFGVLTMFYGAIVALRQTDMKRMVAFTSINHMGFVILGAFAGLAATAGSSIVYGVEGAVFQMFNHAFAIGLMFTLTGVVKHTFETRDMRVIKGMRYMMPLTSIAMGLGALAAMGAPVFSSFLSEFMVIYGGIHFNSWLWLVVLVPGITAAYMLWMLKRMVFSEKISDLHYADVPPRFFLYMILYLVPLVVLIVAPGLLLGPVSGFVSEITRGLQG
jgi:NADH-quinone oxidoreductase subunit M